jgi:hypothetical protein
LCRLTHLFCVSCSSVRATFLQHFGIAGGPNGLMNRSEEVVQINVLNCSSGALALQALPQDSGLSPRALAGSLTRKLRRKETPTDLTPPSKRMNDA